MYAMADCEWVIEATRGRNIQITFTAFEIEEEKSCSYDYLEVYSGVDDSSARLHGRFCGNSVSLLTHTHKHKLYVLGLITLPSFFAAPFRHHLGT
jgi:hypothetical protein